MSGLTDAQSKLDWAKANLEKLAGELSAWKETHGESPPFTTRAEPDTSDYSIAIVIDEIANMPETWAHLTGNIVNDVRSALNYVAWQMYQLGTKPKLKPKGEERVQFPISPDNDARWSFVVKDRLPDVRADHLAIVQKYQPYQVRKTGGNPKNHPFMILAELSRSDKHRTPTFFYSRQSWYKCRIVKLEGYVLNRIDTPPIGTLLVAKPGTELVRIRGFPLVGSPTQTEVIVELMGAAVIGFENGIGLTEGLLAIIKMAGLFLKEISPLM